LPDQYKQLLLIIYRILILEFRKNLFIAGDCAGISQGIVSASITGILVAREIIKR